DTSLTVESMLECSGSAKRRIIPCNAKPRLYKPIISFAVFKDMFNACSRKPVPLRQSLPFFIERFFFRIVYVQPIAGIDPNFTSGPFKNSIDNIPINRGRIMGIVSKHPQLATVESVEACCRAYPDISGLVFKKTIDLIVGKPTMNVQYGKTVLLWQARLG